MSCVVIPVLLEFLLLLKILSFGLVAVDCHHLVQGEQTPWWHSAFYIVFCWSLVSHFTVCILVELRLRVLRVVL